MKKIIHKILSILMTFVLLFSTMSFSINMHYCGGNLVETAFFHKTKGCGMEMEKPENSDCSINKKNCCDEKQLIHDGQDEVQKSVDKISFEQKVFITSFVYSYYNLFIEENRSVFSFEEYKPPIVIRQIYKIDETYLI